MHATYWHTSGKMGRMRYVPQAFSVCASVCLSVATYSEVSTEKKGVGGARIKRQIPLYGELKGKKTVKGALHFFFFFGFGFGKYDHFFLLSPALRKTAQ